MLLFDASGRRLWSADGRVFDPATRSWGRVPERHFAGERISLPNAVAWLQRETGAPCRIPIGIIGGRDGRPDQLAFAEALGRGVAELGLTVVCGGRQGIMEAACRGVARAGGISVGILPDADANAANPFVTVPIATGIGIARNAIVARAALCLAAIGGGYGTLSEAAFGLQFGKVVMAVLDGPTLAGVTPCRDVEHVLEEISRVVLGLPQGRDPMRR